MTHLGCILPTPDPPEQQEINRRARHILSIVVMSVAAALIVGLLVAYFLGVNVTTVLVVGTVTGAFSALFALGASDFLKTRQ